MIKRSKVTNDVAALIQFHIGTQLTHQASFSKGILTQAQFDLVDWVHVSHTLIALPKLFQLWAAKQTHHIAGPRHTLQPDRRIPTLSKLHVSL